MNGCGVTGVLSEGQFKTDGTCCYSVVLSACTGRPFLEGAHAIAAPLAASENDWSASSASLEPCVDALTLDVRSALAEAWARDGLYEHASVASFGRFALELMAVGAPARLVEDAHLAAIDEVRHARLCLGLASAYAGSSLSPGAFPFGGRVEVESDLASIAVRAVREGCVGETIASMQAAEQLELARDPAVRRILAAIAEDEARHAELAWRAVAWAVRTGGEVVRAAVESAFAEELARTAATSESESDADDLAIHGRLSPARMSAVSLFGRAQVIRPAAEALLVRSGEAVAAADAAPRACEVTRG